MNNTRNLRVPALLVSLAALGSGCGPNQRIIRSGNENPPANIFEADVKPAVSTFEKDLESMRTAGFYYIYVYRREDGAPFNAEDKAILAENIPSEVNRRTLSDEGRAVIVGSNFLIPKQMTSTLEARFVFVDHSPKSASSADNTNRSQ